MKIEENGGHMGETKIPCSCNENGSYPLSRVGRTVIQYKGRGRTEHRTLKIR